MLPGPEISTADVGLLLTMWEGSEEMITSRVDIPTHLSDTLMPQRLAIRVPCQ